MSEERLPIKEYNAGDTIIREGMFGREMYILVNGKLDVSMDGVSVATIDSKGSFIGEICALLGSKRVATVKAVTPAKLFVIENVSEYFNKSPDAGFLMAKTLASRLIDMNQNSVRLKRALIDLFAKTDILQKVSSENLESIQNALNAVKDDLVGDVIIHQEKAHASALQS
jgi:CRP-like cAMP-binding protein